jgi:hypothetical protein
MSLSSPMATGPEFKILWSIIVTDAVLVVHRLVFLELASEHLFHHRTMLGLSVTALAAPAQNFVSVFVEMSFTAR